MKTAAFPIALTLLLLFAAPVPAQEPSSAPTPVPAVDLGNPQIRYLHAILYQGKPKADPDAALKALLKDKYPDFVIGPDAPKGKAAILPQLVSDAPKELGFLYNLLPYMGHLSEQERAAIAKTKTAYVLGFNYEAEKPALRFKRLAQANEITMQLAERLGGYPADFETRELFTLGTWSERRLFSPDGQAPNLFYQVNKHGYRDPELIRIVTLGMNKLGLPDVSIKEVSPKSSVKANLMLYALCQWLAENGKLPAVGKLTLRQDSLKNAAFKKMLAEVTMEDAKRTVPLRLWAVEPEQGDAENRQILITADDLPGKTPLEKIEAATHRFTGYDNRIFQAKSRDEALLKARDEARAKLPQIRQRFNAANNGISSLSVKAPFEGPAGGVEYMWVEVLEWKGKQIRGILENNPRDIPGLKAGAKVDVSMDTLFDYSIRNDDGTTEGDKTTGILMQRSAKQPPR